MCLLQLQEMAAAAADCSHDVMYRIDVVTGSALGAGTDANIFCTLSGDLHRSSGEFHLKESRLHVNKFERGQVRARRGALLQRAAFCELCGDGFTARARARCAAACVCALSSSTLGAQVDSFEWRCKPLGRVQEVTIRTDGSGLGADWLLDRVTGEACDKCVRRRQRAAELCPDMRAVTEIPISSAFAGRFTKLHPSVVFEWGRWLDAGNTIAVLKGGGAAQAPRVGSIISKLGALKP
jgi:hypothetical protein